MDRSAFDGGQQGIPVPGLARWLRGGERGCQMRFAHGNGRASATPNRLQPSRSAPRQCLRFVRGSTSRRDPKLCLHLRPATPFHRPATRPSIVQKKSLVTGLIVAVLAVLALLYFRPWQTKGRRRMPSAPGHKVARREAKVLVKQVEDLICDPMTTTRENHVLADENDPARSQGWTAMLPNTGCWLQTCPWSA